MRTFTIMLLALLGSFEVSAGFVELTAEVTSVNDYGTTYRVYASFDHPGDELVAIYSIGSNELGPVGLSTTVSTSFHQDPVGANFATGINPFFFTLVPDLIYDSWLTIGSENASDPEVANVGMSAPLADFAAGNSFTLDGGSWYITPGSNPLAVAGDDLRVLVAQFTITGGGTFALDWNFQWKSGVSGDSFNNTGVTFDSADMVEPVLGCTDETACNFDAAANTDDGSCIVPNAADCETCDGSSIVVADLDEDGVCDADEVIGCQDSTACNYDATATDAGSCIYADGNCEVCDGNGGVAVQDADGDGICDSNEIVGCQDNTACNYNAGATDSDSASCIYPAGCETCSGATDGTGTVVDNDSDNDGICDANEIPGCDDDTACNFDAAATENDGSCDFADGPCDVCEGGSVVTSDADGDGVCDADEIAGCSDAGACNYNSDATDDDGSCYFAPQDLTCEEYCPAGDWDGDGVCDLDEIAGCTSTSATNYDAVATDDDGSCVWPDGFFTGLSFEQIPQDELPGQKTFRVYAHFNTDLVEVAACFGTNQAPWSIYSTQPFYQNPAGALIGSAINPLFFAALPSLAYDSWIALGAGPGDDDSVLSVGTDLFFNDFATNGGNVMVDTEVGASLFYTPGASPAAFPQDGKVLLGQFTTAGVVSLSYNLQFRDPSQSTVQVTDLNITFPVMGPGCMDETACNYDDAATEDDGSCTYPETYYDCDGNCLADADEDGVCDELEIDGCTDETACNYDADATELDDSCVFADGTCEFCDGNGGVEVQDTDGDSVCDADEIAGCTDITACNYSASATDDDGSCTYPEQFLDCAGDCINDTDEDGVCDELEIGGCMVAFACNYDATATDDDGSCVFALEPCEVCNAQGGVDLLDEDGDGVCDGDEIAGCDDETACNYDEAATDNDGSCTYPPAPFDCNGDCLNDADDDGVCDENEIAGCTDATATNFDPEATDDDGSCTQALCNILAACNYVENPAEINNDLCIFPLPFQDCDGNACGGDWEGDGVLEGDEVYGCTSESAVNFDPAATHEDGSCEWDGIFQGLTYEVVAEDGVAGMTTYLVYAQFDPNADVDAISVFGDAQDPWMIATTTSFFQAALGVDFGANLNPGLYSFFPVLAYDTWMTIGAEPGDYNALAQTGMYDYLDSWNNGGDFVVNTDPGASIFLPENSSNQGFPDADGRLLLAQLTTDGIVSLQYNITYQNAANEPSTITDVELSFPAVAGGCMDPTADNYDGTATMDDCSCLYSGCTNVEADNYNAQANVDDGSCLFTGCFDPEADNFWPLANTGDQLELCEYWGCMDPEADNYDETANMDPEYVCEYWGCTDPQADNFDSGANFDPLDECEYYGCMDEAADNYDPGANVDPLDECEYWGCMNAEADNYDSDANVDPEDECLFTGCFDNTAWNYWPLANTGNQEALCQYEGCMDPAAVNYDEEANVQVVTVCDYLGCTTTYADNYDPQATIDDGSCIVEGCMYENADNYDPLATYDDESNGLACTFGPCEVENPCVGDLNGDLSVDVGDLLIFFQQYGTFCSN